MDAKRWDKDEEMLPFFLELDGGNGRPEEKWRSEYDFDPPFLRGQLRRYAKKGWIELDEFYTHEGCLKFRFTSAGRDQFEALGEKRENG